MGLFCLVSLMVAHSGLLAEVGRLAVGRAKPDVLIRREAAVEELSEQTQASRKEFNACVVGYVPQHRVFYSFLRYLVFRPILFFGPLRKVIERPKVASGVERLENQSLETEAGLQARALSSPPSTTVNLPRI